MNALQDTWSGSPEGASISILSNLAVHRTVTAEAVFEPEDLATRASQAPMSSKRFSMRMHSLLPTPIAL